MADIIATIERYESSCDEFSSKPNEYIMKMLDRERDEELLSKNADALYELYVDDYGFQSPSPPPDAKDSMYLYLAGNNKLLCDKRLNDDDIKVLCATLETNFYVTHLDLRYNDITDIGAGYIAKLLETSSHIQEVNLMFNDIGPEGGALIAKALLKNEHLVRLRMTGNKIGNKGGMHFAQALQVNSRLEVLDLGDVDLTIESIIALSTVLHHNTQLKSLNVNRPILFTHQEETTVHFSKMLKENTSLEEIHLQKYDMRDFGASRLAENLMHNFTLTHLDLSCNRITRDGTKELAKVLQSNTALKVLDLGYNRLEDDGAMHIANAIAIANNTLQSLIVVKNNIAGKGLCALADAMKTNTELAYIYIWGNKLEESACIAFANLIETGRLEPEDTDVHPYVVDGVTSLSEKNTHPNRHYYYAPCRGDDIPPWMPKVKDKPRGPPCIIKTDIRNDYS